MQLRQNLAMILSSWTKLERQQDPKTNKEEHKVSLKDKKDWKTDLERVTQRQRKSEKEKANKWKKLENENKKDWDIWK